MSNTIFKKNDMAGILFDDYYDSNVLVSFDSPKQLPDKWYKIFFILLFKLIKIVPQKMRKVFLIYYFSANLIFLFSISKFTMTPPFKS